MDIGKCYKLQVLLFPESQFIRPHGKSSLHQGLIQPALKLKPFPSDQGTQRKNKTELPRRQELLPRALSGLQKAQELHPCTVTTGLSELLLAKSSAKNPSVLVPAAHASPFSALDTYYGVL